MEAVKTTGKTATATATPAAASHHFIQRKQTNPHGIIKPSPHSYIIQPKLTVGAVNSVHEREADSMADKVMRMKMPQPQNFSNSKPSVQPKQNNHQAASAFSFTKISLHKKEIKEKEEEKKIQKKESGSDSPVSAPPIVSEVISSGGKPLDNSTRSYMEPRFGYDFSNVKIHDNSRAAQSATAVGALAYTVGNNVVFNSGQYNPGSDSGKHLLAHELTHVVQQGSGVQRTPLAITHSAPVSVQRWGISDALNFFADKANNIPGFAMLTYLIGVNPINMRPVERNVINLLRGVIGFMPGGELIFQALQSHGIIDRVGTWIQQQLNTLGMAGATLKQAIDRFLASLSWSDVFNLDGVWERAKRIFTDPINRIKNFVVGLVSDILKFIREAILRPVAVLANGTRGYDLIKAVMGQDPLTGEPYARTPENMIGGFMKLIGQEEKWNHLRESNAVGRAWTWFQQQIAILLGFVRQIPELFSQAWERLQIGDLLNIPGAFAKIANVFGGFIERFITWAGDAALQLMKFIFEVLAPGAIPVLNRVAAVFGTIIRDPIRFVGNLVRAGVQGFRQFSTNVLVHLRNGLVGWLTGSLTGAGLQLPQRWDLRGILSLVLQILGLTWANIRQKILRHIPEPVLRTLETTFDILVTLVREGPMAAWNKILEQLGNLQEMVFSQIREWITSTIVGQAITKIASMLNPAGAVIQAIIAVYNTIMFFKERAEQIMQVVSSFFNSMAEIAAGNISAAATFVENTMARVVPVIISFLARLIGLGGISERIRAIIDRIRQPIDRALDKVVEWIVAQARRLGTAVAQAGVPRDPNERLRLGMTAAVGAVNRFAGRRVGATILNPLLTAIKIRYGFQSLLVIQRGNIWAVHGQINPQEVSNTNVQVGENNSVENVLISGDYIKINTERGRLGQVTSINETINGMPAFAYTTIELKRNISGRLLIRAQGTSWQKSSSEALPLPIEILRTQNQFESWGTQDIARKILNFRYRNDQRNEPSKEWEHIIENSAGGEHSYENLALTTISLNRSFNEYFSRPQEEKRNARLPNTGPLKLRDYLKGKDQAQHLKWKIYFYTVEGVSVKKSENERGKWQYLG